MAPSTPIITFAQQMAEVGQTLELFCTAQGGPSNVLQWFKDDEPLTSSQGGLTIETNTSRHTGISSTLTIASLTADDQGDYTCEVSNAAGTASYTAVLVGKFWQWAARLSNVLMNEILPIQKPVLVTYI